MNSILKIVCAVLVIVALFGLASNCQACGGYGSGNGFGYSNGSFAYPYSLPVAGFGGGYNFGVPYTPQFLPTGNFYGNQFAQNGLGFQYPFTFVNNPAPSIYTANRFGVRAFVDNFGNVIYTDEYGRRQFIRREGFRPGFNGELVGFHNGVRVVIRRNGEVFFNGRRR